MTLAGNDFAQCRTGRGLAASRRPFGDAHFPVRHCAVGAEVPSRRQTTQPKNEVLTSSRDLTFEIESISITNDSYLANVQLTNSTQWVALTSIERNTGMLELYFVPSLEGGATAFYSRWGIVVGPSANVRTLSHEIGHACGLPDVYVSHRETSLQVQGLPSKDRMPDDWGWYPPSLTHQQLLQRLLMYGVFSSSKADLSYGDIYGLYYTRSAGVKTWHLNQAPVGFGRHGNRNPVSQ